MHPFVKWAGGKTQLLEKIKELMPKDYKRYFEPFVGGGALLFEIKPNSFTINDYNSELIQAYKCFENESDFNNLIDKLNEYQTNHSEQQYYLIRDMDKNPNFLKEPIYVRAARMIYLNKSCFNGLYRVNSKGYFNVPSSKKKIVNCYDYKNMIEIAEFFKNTVHEITNTDFQQAVINAQKGDFVYFDPPYDAFENKNSFTSYAKNPFGKQEQKRLADVFKELTSKGVYVMLSNHNTEYITELYKNFNIHIVEAKRMINSNGNARGNVEEVIITNYEKSIF